MIDAKAEARFLNAYARSFHAGAFATPLAADIARLAEHGRYFRWGDVAAAANVLTRDSVRRDFTGRTYVLPAGSRLITHLGAGPSARLPSLEEWDWVYAYREDRNVSEQLVAQGREVAATRISAASEIIACWGRPGTGWTVPAHDAATLVEVTADLAVSPADRARIAAEIRGLSTWHDDYPFYSDGSWGAINLRGFNPADPSWGTKPAEMSKAWWAAHPEAKAFTHCDWTVAASWCPTVTAVVTELFGGRELERVRILRMAAREGGGRLSRHTDVTDRAAGVADGHITRFHLPLLTHPAITMSAWDLDGDHAQAHLPPWTMWYLDARKPHAVDNPAGVDRIHLVVDTVADADTRATILAGRDVARTVVTAERTPMPETATLPLDRSTWNMPPDTDLAHVVEDLWPLVMPVEALTLLPANYHQGDVGMVSQSLLGFKQRKPIVVNRRTGHVEAGNTTLQAMSALGSGWVAVVLVDDDDTAEKGYAVADNRASALGYDDPALLADMLLAIHDADASLLEHVGFDEGDLADLIAETASADQLASELGQTEDRSASTSLQRQQDQDGATEGNTKDFYKKPSELLPDYQASGVRSVIVSYRLQQYAWFTAQLAELRKRSGYDNNADVALALVAHVTGEEAPDLDPAPNGDWLA